MLSKSRDTPVHTPAPGVIANTIMSNGAPAARDLSDPASMTFLLFEYNGGGYRWTIVAGGGETLAQSASFGSYEEAERARIVHHGASLASFEDHSGKHCQWISPLAAMPQRREIAWTPSAGWMRAAASAARP